jgi:uncharacterized membrane protein YcaP (DUF421 family)
MELFHQIFGSGSEDITWWQMCARAVLIVLYSVLLFRLAARRIFGRDAVLDIIVGVILGSMLSRALTGNAPLLATLAAAAAVVAMHSVLATLATRVGWFSLLMKGRPTQIVADGAVDWLRAQRADIGEGDLMEELRLHGVADLEDVRAAYLERNGRISVIRR